MFNFILKPRSNLKLFLFTFLIIYFSSQKSFSIEKTENLKKLINLKKNIKNVSGFNLSEKFNIQSQIEKTEKELGGLEAFSNLQKTKIKSFLFVLKSLPIIFWQILLLFSWLLILFFIIFKIIKIGFFLKFLSFLIFGFAVLGFRLSYLDNRPEALILVNDAKLYSGPDRCFPVLKSMPQGCYGKILEEQDSFFKIESNFISGWILKNDVEEIV